MSSVLFEHRNEFDERNAFLLVALGLVSCALEVQALLPRLEASPRGAAAEAEPLDPTVGLLLGLASVSRTILGHADAAVTTAPADASVPDRPGAATDSTLVRKLLAV